MQRQIIISCCAECPAYKLRQNRIPHCEKLNQRIDDNTENPVNLALVGFPEWCPLEIVDELGNIDTDYKKEVKRIMQIMEEETPEALHEASHYLNSLVRDAKKKTDIS
jgi:hypothetical protein